VKCLSLLVLALLGTAAPGYPQAASNTQENNGKLNLSAPAPRLNGKPDLSGVWQASRTPLNAYPPPVREVMTRLQVDFDDVTKNYLNIFWGLRPAEEPLRPEAAALVAEFQKRGDDPQSARCLPASLPASLMVLVFKIVQAPRETVVLFDNGDPTRQIFTDGRSLRTTSRPRGWAIRSADGKATSLPLKLPGSMIELSSMARATREAKPST